MAWENKKVEKKSNDNKEIEHFPRKIGKYKFEVEIWDGGNKFVQNRRFYEKIKRLSRVCWIKEDGRECIDK